MLIMLLCDSQHFHPLTKPQDMIKSQWKSCVQKDTKFNQSSFMDKFLHSLGRSTKCTDRYLLESQRTLPLRVYKFLYARYCEMLNGVFLKVSIHQHLFLLLLVWIFASFSWQPNMVQNYIHVRVFSARPAVAILTLFKIARGNAMFLLVYFHIHFFSVISLKSSPASGSIWKALKLSMHMLLKTCLLLLMISYVTCGSSWTAYDGHCYRYSDSVFHKIYIKTIENNILVLTF